MNGWYQNGLEAFARKLVHWETDTIKCYPVSADYIADRFTHEWLSDVAGHEVGIGVEIPSRIVLDDAVLDGGDITFEDVPAGTEVFSVVVVQDTGMASTSRLLLYFDSGAGFPFPSTGGPISVVWDNSPGRIAQL